MLLSFLLLTGCHVNMKITKEMPDGTKWSASYDRWGNQNLQDLDLIIEPNGVGYMKFSKQISETEMGFNLGVASMKLGGTK
jgi:hypothetical protein